MSPDVTIRRLHVEDARAMVGVLGSPELYTHIGGHPPTEDQLAARYARQVVGLSPDGSQEWMNWIVLIGSSRPVGYVQASRPVGGTAAEIAWVIGVPWQGKGCATAAVVAMLDLLVARGVKTVVADIHPDNAPSVGVARRIGMRATDEVIDGEARWTRSVARADGPRT